MDKSTQGPKVRFDVARMFDRAGGYALDMQEMLTDHFGQAPPLQTIQMWKQRGVIPADWLASVLYALMKKGNRVYEFMDR